MNRIYVINHKDLINCPICCAKKSICHTFFEKDKNIDDEYLMDCFCNSCFQEYNYILVDEEAKYYTEYFTETRSFLISDLDNLSGHISDLHKKIFIEGEDISA